MKTLSSEEAKRYVRNINLPCIGLSGQQKLKDSSVLIVGTGALGSIVSMYLAGAGVGHIGISDFDTIDITNLQRQLSFAESNIGMSKVLVVAQKIRSINSNLEIDLYEKKIDISDANEIFSKYDVIVDGSDNPETMFMINDVCELMQKPYCMGGVSETNGQVMSWMPGYKNYRDLFSNWDHKKMPNKENGIFGPLPGIVGSIQASEVIKIIVGCGKPLFGKMLLIDALTMNFTTLEL